MCVSELVVPVPADVRTPLHLAEACFEHRFVTSASSLLPSTYLLIILIHNVPTQPAKKVSIKILVRLD